MNDLKKIRNKVTSIWSYTELEMGDFSKGGLQKHINKISSIVDEILLDMDQLNLCYLCSNSEVCNSCSDDMERQMYNEELEE